MNSSHMKKEREMFKIEYLHFPMDEMVINAFKIEVFSVTLKKSAEK